MCCEGKIEPEKMAPTERAAIFHGLRVHCQIINWKLLSHTEEEFQIKAEDWGWKVKDSTMYPIKTKTGQAIASESLLKVIRCNCKSKSKLQCTTNLSSYRKHGLTCISSCGECHGKLCDNRKVQNYCSFLVEADLRPSQHLR